MTVPLQGGWRGLGPGDEVALCTLDLMGLELRYGQRKGCEYSHSQVQQQQLQMVTSHRTLTALVFFSKQTRN